MADRREQRHLKDREDVFFLLLLYIRSSRPQIFNKESGAHELKEGTEAYCAEQSVLRACEGGRGNEWSGLESKCATCRFPFNAAHVCV